MILKFLPKNVFLAHELFWRALHLDQQDKRDEARNVYFKAAKIFTSLTKEFPDMTFFYLKVEKNQRGFRFFFNPVTDYDYPYIQDMAKYTRYL